MNEEGRPDRIDGPDDSTDGKPDGDGVGADDQNSGSGSEHDPQEELTRFPISFHFSGNILKRATGQQAIANTSLGVVP